MKYLHYRLNLKAKDAVEVTLDKQANVCLLDTTNFNKYKKGDSFRYLGGLQRVSPFLIRPSRAGLWHLVIDLGGHAGSVRASVRIIKGWANTKPHQVRDAELVEPSVG